MSEALPGPDGLPRCPWALSDAALLDYHDAEWGRPVHGDQALFERLSLEAFQAGLSWLIVLRKRAALRTAFAGFDPSVVAEFGEREMASMLVDPGIVRNAAKVRAVIDNARALLVWQESDGEGCLDALVWSMAEKRPRPLAVGEVPASTPSSRTLARELRARGMCFVGPVTAYAAMQACGVVDDHLRGCRW